MNVWQVYPNAWLGNLGFSEERGVGWGHGRCRSNRHATSPLDFISYHSSIYTFMCVLHRFSRVQLFVTLWTVACQAPLSMGFSRQEYWSGLPCPPPGDLPNPGVEPACLMSPALAGEFFTTEPRGKPIYTPVSP